VDNVGSDWGPQRLTNNGRVKVKKVSLINDIYQDPTYFVNLDPLTGVSLASRAAIIGSCSCNCKHSASRDASRFQGYWPWFFVGDLAMSHYGGGFLSFQVAGKVAQKFDKLLRFSFSPWIPTLLLLTPLSQPYADWHKLYAKTDIAQCSYVSHCQKTNKKKKKEKKKFIALSWSLRTSHGNNRGDLCYCSKARFETTSGSMLGGELVLS